MANEAKQILQDAPAKPARLVYLGPNLSQYGLAKYAIFKGGLPTRQAPEAFERWSLLKLLFAPPAGLAATEAAIQTPGTPQNEAYKQVLKRGEV